MWIARNEGDNYCHLFVYKPTKVYDKYQRRWVWISQTDEGQINNCKQKADHTVSSLLATSSAFAKRMIWLA